MREIIDKFICIICKTKLEHSIEYLHTDSYSILCSRCGNYLLTGTLFSMLQDNDEGDDYWRWVLSHYIRRHYDGKNKVVLDSEKFNKIISNESLPSPIQQIEYLLEYLGKHIKYPSDHITLNSNYLAAIIGAKNLSGVDYIAEHLKRIGLIYFQISGQGSIGRDFGLTLNAFLNPLPMVAVR